jgi:CubicO group peptidase (beta-lactamase class C family)
MALQGRYLRIAAAVVATCGIAVAMLAAGGAANEAALDAYVQSYVALNQFNGAVLVAQDGRVALKKGYGMANFEWSIPVTPDTRFRLGSITKQFTSMLVLQLVEEGKLSLDAKLTDVLPYYRKDAGGTVTIHQLLNHTSGIPSYTDLPNFFQKQGRTALPLKELVTTLCSGDLQFEPGSKFLYNNSGYVILGAVIEQVTGKPYEQVLQERILDPLGMKATGYDHSETLISKRATGYQSTAGGLRNADFLDMSLPYAAGALYSTVEDLYLWDQALYGTKLLSEAGKSKLFTPGLGDYGYGWIVQKTPVGPDKAERTVIQHGGGINGFNTAILRVPEERTVVILLNNTGGAPLKPMALGVLELLHGRTPAPPKEPLARTLLPTLEQKGLEAAIAQYREIKATKADRYQLGEGELNQIGYQLLGAGKVDDAIAIFKLNVEAFPESGNPHDSLGEAYAAKGEKVLAIKSYARSLELDPSNVNAVERLVALTK